MSLSTSWQYEGRDREGKRVKGRVDAPTQSAAVAKVRDLGVAPTSIAEAGSGTGLQTEIRFPWSKDRIVPLKPVAIASRQLATMVGAGLPLLRALTILTEQTEDQTLQKAFADVRDRVHQGSTFSDALAAHENAFPVFMVHIVRAGEAGGFLDGALLSVAQTFERDVKLRQKIKSAMTYPIVVLLIAVLATAVMMVGIVPIFKDMFAGLGAQLPVPTQIVVAISDNMVWIAPVGAAIVIGTWMWWRRNRNRDAVRAKVDPVLLKAPVFGQLVRKLAIARFTRNLSLMLGAGVPILKSLEIVGDTAGNYVVKSAALDIRDAVAKGRPVAATMAQHDVFPAMVSQMVAVGEDSGQLQVMLGKIADTYDQEVETATEQLTAMLEPILIAFLGVLIGGMVIALYLPMFSIYEHI